MTEKGFSAEEVNGGLIILGDSTNQDVIDYVASYCDGEGTDLILTDPPYGKIVSEDWDNQHDTQEGFSDWMVSWTNQHLQVLKPGGGYYVWGGPGVVGYRPFFDYARRVERDCKPLEISNLITWGKKRAYGLPYNYLFTREDCVFMINGDRKHPAVFNVPLLEKERGYEGYNKKYPAKSKFLRRTNVWSDINELFKGKIHPTEKPQKLLSVIIEASSNKGEIVFDPFAGSGSVGLAARNLKREFILIEKDEEYFQVLKDRLAGGLAKD